MEAVQILVPALIVLGILLLLNVLVAVLYAIEYRKNVKILEHNKATITSYKKVMDLLVPDMQAMEDRAAAQKQAQEIIAKANEQAKAMIFMNQSLQQELHDKMLEQFKKALEESQALTLKKDQTFQQEMEHRLLEAQKEHIQMLKKIESQIETNASSEINILLQEMKARVIDFGTKERDYMEKELVKIQQELENYKKEEMAKIEAYIYEILARTSESVLGQAVNLDLHQELIIKALEQAKREGIFA